MPLYKKFRFPSTSYPEINQRGHIGKESVGSSESKIVGVATVLQTTPYGGPHGAWVPEEHKGSFFFRPV